MAAEAREPLYEFPRPGILSHDECALRRRQALQRWQGADIFGVINGYKTASDTLRQLFFTSFSF
jgi:hypothetical protein